MRITIVLLVFVIGCVDVDDYGTIDATSLVGEGFESGSKTAYATATVTLSSGTWTLGDALVGTSTSDAKHGARAARVRNTGRITMGFDQLNGAGTVTIDHATFGSDTGSTWGLFYSQDQGATWTQAGPAVATTSHTLKHTTITVERAGRIRFEIRKLDGGANRINIDDITTTDYDGGGGGGGGGGSGAEISRHTALGLPAPASATDEEAYLSVKSGYVISYNSARKVPNWVSWELAPSYLGTASRQDDYRSDSTLPAGMPQASRADYSESGWDRGHMCPSGDRTRDDTANSETFYLTNMVPQAADINRGPWERLEAYSRSLAKTGKDVFIVAGGLFGPGSKVIGSGVAVPDAVFKVIVVLDGIGQGPGDVGSSTRVIGVIMPNENSAANATADWRSFRVSVDEIELATGADFLSDIDPSVQAAIEARVDTL